MQSPVGVNLNNFTDRCHYLFAVPADELVPFVKDGDQNRDMAQVSLTLRVSIPDAIEVVGKLTLTKFDGFGVFVYAIDANRNTVAFELPLQDGEEEIPVNSALIASGVFSHGGGHLGLVNPVGDVVSTA